MYLCTCLGKLSATGKVFAVVLPFFTLIPKYLRTGAHKHMYQLPVCLLSKNVKTGPLSPVSLYNYLAAVLEEYILSS